MKKVFVLVVCFWCILQGFSQSSNYNCTLSNALRICGKESGAISQNINLAEESCCINGKLKVYYTFVPNRSVSLGYPASPSDTNMFGFTAYTAPPPNATVSVNTSYKFYGPFDLHDNYTDQINNGIVNPLASDSPSTATHYIEADIIEGKLYVVELTLSTCTGYLSLIINEATEESFFYGTCGKEEISCENCLPKFQPVDDRYVVSAWVKELEGSTSGALDYTNTSLRVSSGTNTETFHPSGQIIDGWQRIEGIIQTNSVGNLKMELLVSDGTSYFDDIRVFPYDGSMITYVYDPITLRLLAELDERNYAKIYEYDEEGKLVRVKKETVKGIFTIQENRENSSTNE